MDDWRLWEALRSFCSHFNAHGGSSAPTHENAVAVSGGWGMVVATPEERPVVAGSGAPLPSTGGLTRGRVHFHEKWSWYWAPPPAMKMG